MSNKHREEIKEYRDRIAAERENLYAALGMAIKQRMFLAYWGLQGVPVEELFLRQERVFDHIKKMSETLLEIESHVNDMEAIVDREDEKRDTFFKALEVKLAKSLDEDYQNETQEVYETVLKNLKAQGIKVLRNSEGKHKVEFQSLKSDKTNE